MQKLRRTERGRDIWACYPWAGKPIMMLLSVISVRLFYYPLNITPVNIMLCLMKFTRDHIYTLRVKKFCCCWGNVSWHRGLTCIAQMTILCGIIKFTVCHVLVFRASPSAIPSYIIFPGLTILIYLELLFFTSMGVTLWVSVYVGNLKLIKTFPWALLISYFIAAYQILEIAIEGPSIALALVLSDFGMKALQNGGHKAEQLYKNELVIIYLVEVIINLAGIVFSTYLIILSLSWIDKLGAEIANEDV